MTRILIFLTDHKIHVILPILINVNLMIKTIKHLRD